MNYLHKIKKIIIKKSRQKILFFISILFIVILIVSILTITIGYSLGKFLNSPNNQYWIKLKPASIPDLPLFDDKLSVDDITKTEDALKIVFDNKTFKPPNGLYIDEYGFFGDIQSMYSFFSYKDNEFGPDIHKNYSRGFTRMILESIPHNVLLIVPSGPNIDPIINKDIQKYVSIFFNSYVEPFLLNFINYFYKLFINQFIPNVLGMNFNNRSVDIKKYDLTNFNFINNLNKQINQITSLVLKTPILQNEIQKMSENIYNFLNSMKAFFNKSVVSNTLVTNFIKTTISFTLTNLITKVYPNAHSSILSPDKFLQKFCNILPDAVLNFTAILKNFFIYDDFWQSDSWGYDNSIFGVISQNIKQVYFFCRGTDYDPILWPHGTSQYKWNLAIDFFNGYIRDFNGIPYPNISQNIDDANFIIYQNTVKLISQLK